MQLVTGAPGTLQRSGRLFCCSGRCVLEEFTDFCKFGVKFAELCLERLQYSFDWFLGQVIHIDATVYFSRAVNMSCRGRGMKGMASLGNPHTDRNSSTAHCRRMQLRTEARADLELAAVVNDCISS